MKQEPLQIRRLDTQILERLSLGIDPLVDELPLDLVRARGVPPKKLVQRVRNRLHDGPRHIDVPPPLDDLPVHELADLGHGVVGRPVQLVRLRSGVVVLQHHLQRLPDVDRVHGPEALLQPVRGQQVGGAGELVQQVVLEAEERRRPHDRRFGEDGAGDFFAAGLLRQ